MTSTEVQPFDSGNDEGRTPVEVPRAGRLVADWPPLTPAQLVRLAALLRQA